ncbi:MAG: hypothetical protein GPJ15_00215 [Microcystis aeruginosa G11-06]|nr:hypothetical protein [Microcystis aeruginosa G11-06]
MVKGIHSDGHLKLTDHTVYRFWWCFFIGCHGWGMRIDPQMLSELITLLTPFMATAEAREALLFRAFVTDQKLLQQIDCSGNASTFLPLLIQSLVKYNDGADELIQLLETVKTDVGLDKQEKIDRIINSLNASQRLSQYSPPGASKLQDLYPITVGIRNNGNLCVGTGLIVKGRILTLGSVMRAAEATRRDQISVYLPKRVMNGDRTRRAFVVGSYPDRTEHFGDNDIVVLELTNTLIPEISANMGDAKESRGNPFQMYGYTNSNSVDTAYRDGEILGQTQFAGIADDIYCLALKPEKDLSAQMIGAGVLDKYRNLVVGVLAQPDYNHNAIAFDGSLVNNSSVHSLLISEAV